MKSGLYDDIIGEKPSGLYDDIIKPSKPKVPKSAAAGALVGAIATAQKVIKPKTKAEARQYRKPIGPKPLDVQTFLFGTPKKTEIRSATKEEANRTPEQIEAVAAKMDAEIVRNLSDEDLGAAIEASYSGAYADLPRIPGNRLQIRETLLTERQRRLGEGIVPGVRQVAAFAANLPELTRGSLGSLGGNVQEASAGDTILAAGELAPIPFADDLLRFAGKVGGKLYKGVKEAIGKGDKAKLAQYAKNAEALGWKRPQTEPANPKKLTTQPTPSGVSAAAKREVKPVVKPVEEAKGTGRILYREASPEEFLSRDYLNSGKFYTDNPDIAIGQGSNKGIVFEVRFKDGAKIDEHLKPGTAMPGVGKEYTLGANQATGSGRAPGELVSFTVKKGTKLGPTEQRALTIGESSGAYTKDVLPNGDAKFTVNSAYSSPKPTPKPLESIGGSKIPEAPLSKPTGKIPNPKKVAKEPEVPKVEPPTTKDGPGPTSIALRESEKRGLLPPKPDVRSDVVVAEEAEKLGLGTKEGAAKLVKESAEREMSDTENFGLGVRLANIDRELEGFAPGSKEYTDLIDEAKAIRGIRGTETARALRSRGVLAAHDYTPMGFVRAKEVASPKPLSPKEVKATKAKAELYQKEKARADALQKRLDELAKNAPPPVTKVSKIRADKIRTTRTTALKELLTSMGKMSMNLDPTIVRPLAKYVKTFIDEPGVAVREALENARQELKVLTGEDFTAKDLHEAYLGYRSPNVGVNRTLTEEAIWARRQARRIRAEMDRDLDLAARTAGQKASGTASKLSVEMRLLNPFARIVDQAANASEAFMAATTGVLERPIANAAAKVLKNDARWQKVSVAEKGQMLGRYIQDVKAAYAEAKSGYDGAGPIAHVAGIADAPARAWAQLGYAGERAAYLAKKNGWEFGDVLDQIRDPYLPGPLDFNTARKLQEASHEYADIVMLTNANGVSRARQWVKTGIENSSGIPQIVKPAAQFGVDVMTTFGRVLVNVADKTAQYSNPYYAVARAIHEIAPKKGASALQREVNIRQFAAIARRGGIGMAVTNLGYQMYQDPSQRKGPIGEALNALGTGKVTLPEIFGPTMVQGRNKKNQKTGNVWIDDGYISMLGGVMAALTAGYRNAMIDASDATESQKAKMRHEMLFAPLSDNPMATNTKKVYQMAISGEKDVADTLSDWIIGLYYPGGVREYNRIEQALEGVYGRRAPKMFEDEVGSFQERAAKIWEALKGQVQKRTPGWQKELPPSAVKRQ